ENIQLCTPPHPSPALGRGEPNSIRGSGMKTIFTLFCVRQQSNYCTTKETFSVSGAPEPASVVLTSKTYWPFGKLESGVETFDVTVSEESSSKSARSTGADRWNNWPSR